MKTINKIILALTASIAAASFSGCTNSEVNVQESIEITLRPSTILSGFTPYQSSDFEMYSDSENGVSKLRITCLIYDASGKLAYRKDVLTDGYNKDISVTATLNGGSYRLIALAGNILGTLESPTIEAYSITGADYLNQLQVKQNTEKSFYSTWSILGYVSRSISDSEDDIILNLEPATSLVNPQWKTIHAHDNDGGVTSDIYGEYSATATDYWGDNTYTWPMTVEKDGSSTTDVIVKNFSPAMYEAGLTADKGYNTFKGKISGNTIVIPKGQSTGYSNDEGEVLLEGGAIDGDYITFEDVVLQISDGVLTTTNMFGICIPNAEGWFELFDPGVVFTKNSSGIDSYYIIYHLNDIMKFSDSGVPQYSTSLSSIDNSSCHIDPIDNPDANNIYDMINLFPGTIRIFARTFVGNSISDYSNQTVTLDAGHQYVFSLDCVSFKLTAEEAVLGAKSASVDFDSRVSSPFGPVRKLNVLQRHF